MRTGLFNQKEEDVAKKLGLTRDVVRELRAEHLYQDEDFGKLGREICYAEDGVQKIKKVLKKNAPPGVTLGDLSPMNIKAGPNAANESVVILDAVVTEIYQGNHKYLGALLGGKDVTVHVFSNVNFTEDMVIPGMRLTMINPLLFDFIGRCPQARGRW